jgi:hypothetical protein
MNKEQEQIIDEVYENYLTNFIPPTCPPNLDVQPDYYKPITKEWFIKSAKERGIRGDEFSERWGLKIEERELSHDERFVIYKKVCNRDLQPHISGVNFKQFHFDESNIPTKLITITYNNKTIESYE